MKKHGLHLFTFVMLNNEAVDKTRFDGMRFNLKFPSVDDIVAEILQIKGDIYLSKIDVARGT